MTTVSGAEGAVFVSFVDSIPLAVMVHTMDFRIVAANKLCEDVLGCSVQQMLGRLVADFVPREDHASARAMAEELDRTYSDSAVEPARPIGSLRRVLRHDGSMMSCWMQVGIATLGGRRVIVACMDLIEPVGEATAKWRERAERDDLTGLLRRRPFLDRVETWVELDVPITLAFVDVDRLKIINDTYGHTAGDLVLEAAARRLEAWAEHRSAVVGRFAGDEFVVAVGASALTADRLQSELRRAVCSEPVAFASELLVVSISIGAVERRAREDSRILVARADALMYRDKAVRRSD